MQCAARSLARSAARSAARSSARADQCGARRSSSSYEYECVSMSLTIFVSLSISLCISPYISVAILQYLLISFQTRSLHIRLYCAELLRISLRCGRARHGTRRAARHAARSAARSAARGSARGAARGSRAQQSHNNSKSFSMALHTF